MAKCSITLLACFILIFMLMFSGCSSVDPITEDIYTTGEIYIYDGAAWQPVTSSSGNVVSAANLADNSIIRGDGGGFGVQDSGVTIDDFDNLDTNGGDITGEDIYANNDVNVGNDLDVTDDVDIGGDLTVVGALDAPHADTHEWRGDDEVNIRYLRAGQLPVVALNSEVATTTTTNGTGFCYTGALFGLIGTGGTINSVAGNVWYGSYYLDKDLAPYRFFLSREMSWAQTDMVDAWCGFVHSTTVYPTTTSNHAAFHFLSDTDGVDATIYASCGNGVTGNATAITTMPPWTSIYMMVIYGNGYIDYYYSWDAVTWTYATRLTGSNPDDVNVFCGIWINNLEADAKAYNFWQPILGAGL